MWRSLVGLLFAILIGGAAMAAEFHISRNATNEGMYNLELSGSIVEGDYERFIKILKQEDSPINTLSLRSPGGNVMEAIKIGRAIRKLLIPTNAPSVFNGENFCAIRGRMAKPSQCICFSSCFLIFVAGTQRSGNVLGIHRPRFEEAVFARMSSEQASKKYNEAVSLIRDYLSEMGVSNKYMERMLRVSSSDMVVLTPEEAKEDFDGHLPEYEEWLKARCGEIPAREESYWAPFVVQDVMQRIRNDNAEPIDRKMPPEMRRAYKDYEARARGIVGCRFETMVSERKERLKELDDDWSDLGEVKP